MTHLINRLLVEINCSDEEQAFNVRHNLSQTLQQKITEVVERICSKYVPDQEYLQIDKLEFDLGKLSAETIDSAFDAAFLKKFEHQLTEKLADVPHTKRAASKEHAYLESLKHFLQKGVLPWWATETTIDLDEISSELITHNKAAVKSFLGENRHNPIVWQRAAFQLNEQTQQVFIVLFEELSYAIPLFNELLQQIKKELSKVIVNEVSENILKKLHCIIDNPSPFITGNAPAIFAAEKTTAGFKIVLATIISDYFGSEVTEYEAVLAVINKTINGAVISAKEGSSKKEDNNQQEKYQEIKAKLIQNKKENGERQTKNVSEKLTVKQAGIILVTPFFKPFFTKLQLVQNDKWKNKQAQHKAIYLLSYLSNGNRKVHEYQLLLEKLICGVPLEEPLPATIVLSEEELRESEALLESVIEHWSALKNTSINGLRASFLKRDGILTGKENGWLLQLESKTVDVLLDSIPWSYSTIQLPWNEYIITTVW